MKKLLLPLVPVLLLLNSCSLMPQMLFVAEQVGEEVIEDIEIGIEQKKHEDIACH